MVCGEGHLAHQVAGDEDRAAFGGQDRSRWRTQRMPSGSRPFTGSSRAARRGRRAGLRRCRAAGPCRARTCRPACGPPRQPDQLEHLVDPSAGMPVARASHQQVVAGAAARVDGLGLQQGADLVQRGAGRGTGWPLTVTCRRSAVETHDHPHRGRLARAVRPEEPGDVPGGTVNSVRRRRACRRSAW